MQSADYYFSQIQAILTYNGNELDIQINYGMLLLSMICWCFTVLRVFNTIKDFCWFTFSCLYILFGVQIGVCMFIQCIGISGVWCAMVGFAYRMWVHSPADPVLTNKLVVFATFGSYLWANFHYFRAEESYITFTSICHILATWLGYEANNIWIKSHQSREEKQHTKAR